MLFPQTIEEFHNIFGPELKAVTGDPERIEEVVERVDSLVIPIEQVNISTPTSNCNLRFCYVVLYGLWYLLLRSVSNFLYT